MAAGSLADYPWPANDRGNADATLISGSFASPQRNILCEEIPFTVALGQAAIVGSENDDRVFPETFLLERFHDSPYAHIETHYHGGIGGIVVNRFWVHFAFKILHQIFSTLDGGVRRMVGEIHEERSVLGLLDLFDCLIGQVVRAIVGF